MSDLLALTAELVAVPSVSHNEGPLADRLEAELQRVPGLAVDRLGDNVVARTDLGRDLRLVIAGHTDTVPGMADGGRIQGDTLWGLGAADMKSGLAVMLELARTAREAAVDITYVFYAGEEVEARYNGLGLLFAERPDLLTGDVALLGEPTDGAIEAGCQGTIRLRLELRGVRAHTARPWVGRNAIHRLAPVVAALEGYEARRPTIDGCEYREALQAVRVEGGVAGNVVPDAVTIVLNHRFAPDRTVDEAAAHVRELLVPTMEDGDVLEVVDAAAGAPPSLGHPLLEALIARGSLTVRAKLGWTDVARFAAAGIPAANFGPGDPLLAHTADERVERAVIDRTYRALFELVTEGPL